MLPLSSWSIKRADGGESRAVRVKVLVKRELQRRKVESMRREMKRVAVQVKKSDD